MPPPYAAISADLAAGVLGDFQLIREIGRGGMGQVYEAEQISLGRRVAIKILPLAQVLSSSRLRRFKHEARVAAQLKHPNIVDVYAVGCDQGVDYYAMEFVEGRDLAEIVNEVREARSSAYGTSSGAAGGNPDAETVEWDPDRIVSPDLSHASDDDELAGSGLLSWASDISPGSERQRVNEMRHKRLSGWYAKFAADLALQITRALAHAHRMGVVHRDIKPSNLMLAADGRVLVMDFGLCRIANERDATASGTMLGTLRYASPEQASGKLSVLDERADIYSLGATLYELLTLQPPFTSCNSAHLMHQVLHENPVPPRKLAPWISSDLETIVLKAMAKEKAERYQSAEELGDDLRRYLEDRPIRAKRPSLASQISKWSRRNAAVVTSLVACLLLFCIAGSAGLLISNIMISRERAEIRRLQAETDRARRVAEFRAEELVKAVEQIRSLQKETDNARRIAEDRAEALEREIRKNREQRYLSDILLGVRALVDGDLRSLTETLVGLASDEDMHSTLGLEFGYLWHRAHSTFTALEPHEGGAYHVSWSPDGTMFATCGLDGRVLVYRADAARPFIRLDTNQGEVNGVAFSPQGDRIASAGDDGTVKVWDLATKQKVLQVAAHKELAFRVQFTPDGQFLVSCGREETIRVWDASTGKPAGKLEGHQRTVETIRMLPSHNLLVSVSHDDTVGVWSLETFRRVLSFEEHDDKVVAVGCSPNGELLATGDMSGGVIIWKIDGNQAVEVTRRRFADGIESLAFSPDDKQIAAGDRAGVLHVWRHADEGPDVIDEWQAHYGKIYGLEYNPSGAALISAGQGGPVRSWRLTANDSHFSLAAKPRVNDIQFVAGSRRSPSPRRRECRSWTSTRKGNSALSNRGATGNASQVIGAGR